MGISEIIAGLSIILGIFYFLTKELINQYYKKSDELEKTKQENTMIVINQLKQSLLKYENELEKTNNQIERLSCKIERYIDTVEGRLVEIEKFVIVKDDKYKVKFQRGDL